MQFKQYIRNKKVIIALSVVVIVLIAGSLSLWWINGHKAGFAALSNDDATATPTPSIVPTTPSILDGTLTSDDLASRHPLGVMIENHPDARPQYGLSAASVVYEAIAEGGITRFLAIFGPNDAAKVGPIRSARTYYVDWCDEYDCYYSHVGGNADALEIKIPKDKVKDLDQFANAKSYYRDYSRKVAEEHTMFSSTKSLFDLAKTKKWTTPLRDSYNIYKFLPEPTTPVTPTTTSVTVDFSTPVYKVVYTYDPTTNSYLRNMAGIAHVDANTSKQISAKNIVIQYISRSQVTTRIGEVGWAMPTVGSGKAEIYQGGQKVVGTWTKSASNNRTEFKDASGNLIKLYAGSTWVEVINPGSTVTSN